MNPGYELYLKLMIDFPLPNDQYRMLEGVPGMEDKTDLDTPTSGNPNNARKSQAGISINTCQEVAESNESPTSSKSSPTNDIRSQPHHMACVGTLFTVQGRT